MDRGLNSSSRHSSSKTSTSIIAAEEPTEITPKKVTVVSPEHRRVHEAYLIENFLNSKMIEISKAPDMTPMGLSTIAKSSTSPQALLKSYQYKLKKLKSTPPKTAPSPTSFLLKKSLELDS